MADYTIDRGLGVRDRMNLLATVHSPATLALLDMLGVALGARCIDLGCGGGHIAFELARRVGTSGHVTGLDLDEALLAAARDEAAVQGLDNVTFGVESVEHLAATGFDLAFTARMLLSHLSDPADLVGRMAGAVLRVASSSWKTCTSPGASASRFARPTLGGSTGSAKPFVAVAAISTSDPDFPSSCERPV